MPIYRMCTYYTTMPGQTIFANPVTQTAEAVQALITFDNGGKPPAELPDFYRMSAEMVLVRNNVGDAYYVTTPKTCSCPSATYRSGPCKHQRKYFPAPEAPKPAASEPLVERGGFKPWSPLPGEMEAA